MPHHKRHQIMFSQKLNLLPELPLGRQIAFILSKYIDNVQETQDLVYSFR